MRRGAPAVQQSRVREKICPSTDRADSACLSFHCAQPCQHRRVARLSRARAGSDEERERIGNYGEFYASPIAGDGAIIQVESSDLSSKTFTIEITRPV